MTDQPAAKSRTNPFWEFSLRIYSDAAVQQACVELQDVSGVDVNVLLYMLWHAAEDRTVTNEAAAAVVAAIEPWRMDVVVPLRSARRNLKTPAAAIDPAGAENLRAIVKKAELEAERLQQQALYNWRLPATGDPFAADASRREIAAANVAAYASALGRPLAAAPLGVMLDAFEAVAVDA